MPNGTAFMMGNDGCPCACVRVCMVVELSTNVHLTLVDDALQRFSCFGAEKVRSSVRASECSRVGRDSLPVEEAKGDDAQPLGALVRFFISVWCTFRPQLNVTR